MSLETIDMLNEDRKNQVEESPSSEEFSVVDSIETFKGIFDRALFQSKTDEGNVRGNYMRPLIMVSTIPSFLVEEDSVIVRENGESYTFKYADKDEEGVPVLWLV